MKQRTNSSQGSLETFAKALTPHTPAQLNGSDFNHHRETQHAGEPIKCDRCELFGVKRLTHSEYLCDGSGTP